MCLTVVMLFFKIYTVFQKSREHVFDDKLNYTVFQKKTCDHVFDNKLQRFLAHLLLRVICVVCSVPQGSVLGPRLFVLYTAELADKADEHGVKLHAFADDTQWYVCTLSSR